MHGYYLSQTVSYLIHITYGTTVPHTVSQALPAFEAFLLLKRNASAAVQPKETGATQYVRTKLSTIRR